jgi:hypothetical protein
VTSNQIEKPLNDWACVLLDKIFVSLMKHKRNLKAHDHPPLGYLIQNIERNGDP